ncbi:MAG: M56 family metallopeptidase [bacterium]
MDQADYRKEAVRALWGVVVVSVVASLALGVAAVLGAKAFRGALTALGHMCLRVWRVLPDVVQGLAVVVMLAGLAAAVFWLAAALSKWWETWRYVRSLRRHAVGLPLELLPVLHTLGLMDHVVAVGDVRPYALTAGLFAPKIIISTGLIERLDEGELEAVLLHEASHAVHRDPLALLVSRALAAGFFYLPVAKALAVRQQAALELAADQYALARLGDSVSLSSAMLKLLNPAPAVTPASAFTSVTDVRLSLLLGRGVDLPGASPRALLESWVAVAVVLGPAAGLYGLVWALNVFPILTVCPV